MPVCRYQVSSINQMDRPWKGWTIKNMGNNTWKQGPIGYVLYNNGFKLVLVDTENFDTRTHLFRRKSPYCLSGFDPIICCRQFASAPVPCITHCVQAGLVMRAVLFMTVQCGVISSVQTVMNGLQQLGYVWVHARKFRLDKTLCVKKRYCLCCQHIQWRRASWRAQNELINVWFTGTNNNPT